jgi:ABC-type transport system substrate-binding protein
MKKFRVLFVFSLLVFVALAGCAAPTPETIVETVVVTEVVTEVVEGEVVEVEVTKIVTEEVEKVVVATPEAGEPVFLRYADKSADLGTMDPHFAASTSDRNLVDMIFNGLIRYKPGDGSVWEPDLAEALPEPELVDGTQVWTFNLRRGVMCHPSDEVPSYELTSEDVVWSLNKSANADQSA